MQELNRSIILNMIREYGPISRSDIAKRKQISPTTVASAVKELIQAGLVCEDGAGASNGGRKPIMLRISPENRFLIGVSVTNYTITVAEINLEANIRKTHTVDVAADPAHGEQIVQLLLDSIAAFIAQIPYMDRCIGISISVPGIVDNYRGIVYYNSKLNWHNVALKDIIENSFQLKTWIENDMNAMVLAEKKFGQYSKFRNLLYVHAGGGIGAGIVVNDEILRGARGGAGEFGHTSVDRNGIRCECGNVGCLETCVNWDAVRAKLQAAAASDRSSALWSLTNGKLADIRPSDFSAALNVGDPAAMTVMNETLEYLGAGIVNMVNLFNPDVVILGGKLLYGNDVMIDSIKSYVRERALQFSIQSMEVHPSSLGDNAELIGAASILLQDVFRFSLT
ncbi:transcriptional regulator [Gordoniibacillus kamchatkensis]|uniref:Transcriptional regulator n=2 Tax=Gordoniibacillus kamchatkensis TaxID=1590651 RepID=A0ABR5AHX1_9BACL|nr:transcriptional regulator [Paenibacillus sp. VKM B-2647]